MSITWRQATVRPWADFGIVSSLDAGKYLGDAAIAA
jgi:hypothetical protein